MADESISAENVSEVSSETGLAPATVGICHTEKRVLAVRIHLFAFLVLCSRTACRLLSSHTCRWQAKPRWLCSLAVSMGNRAQELRTAVSVHQTLSHRTLGCSFSHVVAQSLVTNLKDSNIDGTKTQGCRTRVRALT